MQNILTGIYSRYNADSTLKAALPGGVHLEMAPQGTSLAYGVMTMVSGRPDYYLAGKRFEVVTIQFDIYAATNAARLTAYNAMIALFDDARPTVTGYSSIIMERQLQQFVRDGAQNEIFRAVVTYDARFLKS